MEGLIYKVQPYKESSRLIFVYTPKGKHTLIAKGAQKLNDKTRVITQYLTHLSFKEKEGQTFYTLQDAKLLNEFSHIKNDYQKTKQAAVMLEIIDLLMLDHINDNFVFNEIIDALNEQDIYVSSLSFALKMLKPLGYDINLAATGKKIKGVSIEKGGLVYENEPYSVDLNTKDAIFLLKLYVLPYNEHGIYEIDILKKIENFIKKYYQYHINVTLKHLN
jgi:DNA repair protein RecO (recombination protein O)